MRRPTKEELVEQLKSLANTETEPFVVQGLVTCYCMSPIVEEEKTCESCGNQKVYFGWESNEEVIRHRVQMIRELGFDAKVERLCAHCAAKLGLTKKDLGRKDLKDGPLDNKLLYYVFYFKTKEQKEYNITISDDTDEYEVVIDFLEDNEFCSIHHETRLIKDELGLIKRMTGISID